MADLIYSDLECEIVCLDAMISTDDSTYAAVRKTLTADMFLGPDNQTIFKVVTAIRDAGGEMDGHILATELHRRGVLDEVGGYEYLTRVLRTSPNPSNARTYSRHVVETYRLRCLEVMADRVSKVIRLPNKGDRSAQLIEEMQVELANLAGAGAANHIQTIGEAVGDAIGAMGSGSVPTYIPTGIRQIDEAIGGVGIGEMTLIAARPSQGKSLLGKQIANNVAARGIPVFLGNVEEDNQKTARNWLSLNARIDNQRIRQNKLTRSEMEAMPGWKKHAGTLPYYLCDTATDIGAMCNVIQIAHARHGIKVAMVDYLQLLEPGGKGDNRQEQVAEVSRKLKNLFKRLRIAGVVMAQLNRGNEAGQIRPPRLSDLRESGQLEQDADAVLMIHRPDFYVRENGATASGKVQVIIAKYRDGSREGDVELEANLANQEFSDGVVDPFRGDVARYGL